MDGQLLKVVFVSHLVAAFGSSAPHRLEFLTTGRFKSKDKPVFEQITTYDNIPVLFCDVTKKEHFETNLLDPAALADADCEKDHNNIIEAIYNIKDHSSTTVDVVQRRRVCSHSSKGDIISLESWAVNGMDFLDFDCNTDKWKAKLSSALPIEKLWDGQHMKNHDYSVFLRTKCAKMIELITLKTNPSTDLHVFAKPVQTTNEAVLCCHLTTSDPTVKTVFLIGNGATHVRGFTLVGPLPSGSADTWVIRLTAMISLSGPHLNYGCAVQSEGYNISMYWNGKTLDGQHIYHTFWEKTLPAIFGFISVISLILCLSIAIIFFLKHIKRRPLSPPPPPPPEVTEQFERFIQSSTLYPDIRNYLLSFIYGTNTPEHHRDSYGQWLEMIQRQNDPEFYPAYRQEEH